MTTVVQRGVLEDTADMRWTTPVATPSHYICISCHGYALPPARDKNPLRRRLPRCVGLFGNHIHVEIVVRFSDDWLVCSHSMRYAMYCRVATCIRCFSYNRGFALLLVHMLRTKLLFPCFVLHGYSIRTKAPREWISGKGAQPKGSDVSSGDCLINSMRVR